MGPGPEPWGGPNIGGPSLRRLRFESGVVLTAALKATVETQEQSAPKPIPVAERAARLTALRNRLTGVNIQGVGEPSHALIDEACHQYETRTLEYIEPTRCTSRELEVTAGKSDKKIKLDSGTLSVKESKTVRDEAVSSTYHLAQCLRRRGLAYDFANLISFNVREQYVDQLMRHLSIEPPPGYGAPTLRQIIKADKEVFTFLAQNIQDIRPLGNVKPLDAGFDTALRDYNTTFHLLPLPKAAARERAAVDRSFSFSEPYPTRPKGKGKSRGAKGKQKPVGGASSAPRGYPNCTGRDSQGRRLCFDWNLGECDKAPKAAMCAF